MQISFDGNFFQIFQLTGNKNKQKSSELESKRNLKIFLNNRVNLVPSIFRLMAIFEVQKENLGREEFIRKVKTDMKFKSMK